MSTLSEIERAVTALPTTDQQELLTWLQSMVANSAKSAPPDPARHEAWLQRLEQRRQHAATATQGTPLQQIMDDLRGTL